MVADIKTLPTIKQLLQKTSFASLQAAGVGGEQSAFSLFLSFFISATIFLPKSSTDTRQPITFLVDTGSSISLLPKTHFRAHEASQLVLKTANGARMTTEGV